MSSGDSPRRRNRENLTGLDCSFVVPPRKLTASHSSPAPTITPRVERALSRYHTLLRLIELGAPAAIVAHSECLVAKSIEETGLAEVDLARRYPTFRLAVMGLELGELEPN